MRVRLVTAVLLSTAVIGTAAGTTSPVAASPAAPATVVKIVRPVTAAGHAAPGFSVDPQGGKVSCGYGHTATVVAVDPDIDECYPSAAYAVACWNHRPMHVLCMRDPSKDKLVLLRRGPKFADTHVAKARDRSPFLIVLADGTRCTIRDGGAWGWIPHHPHWYGSYSCDAHGVVWTKPHRAHSGVDESESSWTVQTSKFSWPLKTRHVAKAYFVGTAG